ncbi:hypothetical protein CRV24_002855 [Beauveria bassiana]|nr:hypothetical protein CRV24_002855 [Beauveria bassiana]KAH8718240.1 hypothetical protein HC256_002891 [Beauveria bassiana]
MFPILFLAAFASQAVAAPAASNTTVRNWLYTSQIDNKTLDLLDRPDIEGVQALYSWKSLEPQQDEYDFSRINHDLELVQAKGKRLWVQLQDRTFSIDSNPVPKYLHAPIYNNGSVPQCDGSHCDTHFQIVGWVAAQWNEHVRRRFQALLKAMSAELDGRIYGMNLAETSIIPEENKNNFTHLGYFDGELDNAAYAASVFHESYVVQYVNFWPCEPEKTHNYFVKSFDFFAKHGVGIGGPDLIPYKAGQEDNSYPFLHEYRNKVPISVIAVQEPDLREINPYTHKKFTRQEFTDYAVERLGSQIIFWTEGAHWLN